MKADVCIKKCRTELDNEHLVWCKFINEESDYKNKDILNGNIQDKVRTFKQIQINEEIRKEEQIVPCDPVISVDPLKGFS